MEPNITNGAEIMKKEKEERKEMGRTRVTREREWLGEEEESETSLGEMFLKALNDLRDD